MLVDGSLRTVLDPQTATYTVRVPRAGLPASVRLKVRLVAEVDGAQQWAEFFVSGGVNRIPAHRGGGIRTESVLTWTLPHGFFDTDGIAPALFDSLRAKRWGETAKSTFRCWADVEVVRGALPTLPTFAFDRVATPANPDARYHHSIAFENATSTFEDGGDGVTSVSFTANTGTNRAALVTGGSDRSGQVTSHTVTYGGASPSITRPWNVTDGSYSRCTGDVFIDSEIGSGAKTITNTCSETTDGGSGVGVVAMSGVHQTTPCGTAQTSASTSAGFTSVTVTSVNSTDLVVDGIYCFDTAITIGADQTSRTSATAGVNIITMSTQLGSAGGVMSWTSLGGEHSYGAVAFKEASGASGTGAGAFAKLTGAATGTQTQTSTAAGTFRALTGAATGVMLPSGTGAGTFARLTGAATGTQTQTATAAGTFAALTGTATGVHGGFTGTGAGTLAALTGAAVGVMLPSGVGAGTFAALTGAAVGTQTQTSTAAGTFAALTGAAVGTQGVAGTGAGTFAALTGAAVGTQTQTATAAGTLAALTGAAIGVMLPSGTAAGTFAALTGAAVGTGGTVILTPLQGRLYIEPYLAGRVTLDPYVEGGLRTEPYMDGSMSIGGF